MFWLSRTRVFGMGLIALFGLLAFQGAPVKFNKLKSGVEYRVYRRENGRYVLRPPFAPTGDATYATRVGKIMALHMQFRTGKDSVLLNSRQTGGLLRAPLDTLRAQQRGSIEEALSLLQPGDSAIFRFSADSVFAKSFRQPVPPFIQKAGNTFIMLAKAVKVQTQEAAQADAKQEALQAQARAKKQEDTKIKAYMTQQKLTGPQTAGGVYYIVTKPGTGPKPQPGQTVSVLYTGMLLSGKVFDSSEKNGGQPISFPLGQHQVIQGWDEGIAMLNQGSKAILLIPASLAYGARGAGADIPPNAILRFDVELVDVK
ncbi:MULTISPECIES: FKBP-type peptidyl-prolyl cis-trans isomerase [Hymenobacter]|uniref:Peptidyl-prolyl cis-trans isomerase n=1 Tax=Hymenobacter mucosus TaxID=1411120 RepID=A0A238ZPG6_9BACT|nr:MULTISPECIES: FKBP-type peptidyl-prolyl cis-trans isomerase [Hymenobacter]SNR85265.1 FKBP-type peptidyl-prolyl cis-trans isomerase [Hymenobacter mucosus]